MDLRRKHDLPPYDDSRSGVWLSLLRMLSNLADVFEDLCLVHVRVTAALHLFPYHVESHAVFGSVDHWMGVLVLAKSL